MDLLIALTIGILVACITLIVSYEPPSLLKKRFKNSSLSVNNSLFKNFMKYLQDKIKPFSNDSARTKQYINKTKKLLLQSGLASSEEDVVKYETRKIANTIIAGIAGALFLLLMWSFTLETLIGYVIFLYLIYKWPDMKLKKRIKLRQREFMKYLPDAVDLLSICVQAGLGLDSAFSKVADEFELTSETIAVEFDRLNKDILSGMNRRDAYSNLVLRNENQDLQSFVALLIQTDKLGTSISQSLEAFCDSLRTKKRQRIEELSQQASTKMTIPMVLFMLPAIFIIIMYPALQKIMTNLH